ncbi:sigma 54-interacting transcriptional regulator [Massilia sp. IC2-477]|uniref:sigma 54-interacting transcriptional regulator n=1 Tax=Massilia sp. IC2-477 TaxID=2887198 RepID=UPI001D11E59E|nr:sigma 54-interacting transcriptional regulator [Massilia sp. IC2-477]MCC2957411.1 sigma 54-interacting transcriptional regulator [Massilia sp. IC2-477]
MTNTDFTLTSPLGDLASAGKPLLALTIVWHPERARVGEQFIGATGGDIVELNRFAPAFMHPGGSGLPLGHGGVSRQPLRLARDEHDGVAMTLPASAMVVEVNGQVATGSLYFSAAEVASGQVLSLGRAVVLCLHWMTRLPTLDAVPGLHGVGSAGLSVREQIRMVARTSLPVLLLGETGTGKEIAARAIHALSDRAEAPLVAVNMAALGEPLAATSLFGVAEGAQASREGLFAQADGATLFLDEIGSTPAAMQPMLLRVLEGGDYRPVGAARDRHSSARLIAASDQDLDGAAFNQALLHRLAGFVIRMPPLRARREDIGVLIVELLREQGIEAALPAALVAELASYDWPGNVRQLAHVLQRAALILNSGATPTLAQLVRSPRPQMQAQPAPAPTQAPATEAPAARRRPSALSDGEVLEAMTANDWNIQAAAGALGISRPSLYKLLEDHPDIRRAETIPEDDIARAMSQCAGDVERCAALLRTPAEALRRRWRLLRPD